MKVFENEELRYAGFIGFGNMGEAIASGLYQTNSQLKIGIVEKSETARKHAASKYHAEDLTDSPQDLFSKADVVVIAIKPQDFSVLKQMVPASGSPCPVVSVAAGKKISEIAEICGTNQVVRFMPNLAAKFGKSPVGVSFHPQADKTTRSLGIDIAKSIGTAHEIPEKLMPAITGLSGSGIAYVLSFIHGLAMGGTKTGIPYAQSLEIARLVLEGTCKLLEESGEHPESLVSKVTSPAGTTIEGIHILEESGFKGTVIDAVEAASDRAFELENI